MISAIASVIEQDVSAWNEEAKTDDAAPEDAPTETTDARRLRPKRASPSPRWGKLRNLRVCFRSGCSSVREKRALGRRNWRNKARLR